MLNPFTGEEMPASVICLNCLGTGKVIPASTAGELARNYRAKSGRTQIQVAKAMGISAAYLSDLERGQRAWNQRLFAAYKEACDADA